MMNRTFVTFTTVLALAAIPSWRLSANAAPEDQNNAAQYRFQAMDKNGDRTISRAEWQGSARSFIVHDWNGDGVLSGEEIRIGAQRNSQWDQVPYDNSSADRYVSWTANGFRNLDHNGDNRISRTEWHYDVETFRRVDRNGDGSLTQPEFLGGDDYDDDRGDLFDDLDVNNNGRVERSEWHAGASVFSSLDRNRDGALSRSEVVGGTTWTDNLYDQFASLDVNNNGSIDQNEWHWSMTTFDRRDLDHNSALSRREFEASGGAPTAAPRTAVTRNVTVNPKLRWTDTGVDVFAGETITFNASGSITMSTNTADTATPAGSRDGRKAAEAPILNEPAGVLIARVGDYSPVFIGAQRTVRMPVTGRLYLGVNDDYLEDNSGSFSVTVARSAAR